MGTRLSASTANEIGRDGRFIAYSDGTVLDTRTNLMWAADDNGANINWSEAKNYCEKYRGGGYRDWRMPTQDELAGLYDKDKSQKSACKNGMNHIATNLIYLTCCCPWASEIRGTGLDTKAAYFGFEHGPNWSSLNYDMYGRALPVRSLETKKESRFIDNGNGTVTDTKTGLMWAAKDNGSDIKWTNAKSYCENYRVGGFVDWRMPSQDELAGLYDASKSQKVECGNQPNHIATDLIYLTCGGAWASEARDDGAANLYFDDGKRYWGHKSGDSRYRALPVRSDK